jgi:hypothetical protein
MNADAKARKQQRLHHEVVQSYMRLREAGKLPEEYLPKHRASDPGAVLGDAIDRVSELRDRHRRSRGTSCPGF